MDVENGDWAMYGAKLGTYMTMVTGWDYREVQDFDALNRIWDQNKVLNLVEECSEMSHTLSVKLGLPAPHFTADQSRFFKHHYKSVFKNRGPMVRE
jgi:hypothetical protein